MIKRWLNTVQHIFEACYEWGLKKKSMFAYSYGVVNSWLEHQWDNIIWEYTANDKDMKGKIDKLSPKRILPIVWESIWKELLRMSKNFRFPQDDEMRDVTFHRKKYASVKFP